MAWAKASAIGNANSAIVVNNPTSLSLRLVRMGPSFEPFVVTTGRMGPAAQRLVSVYSMRDLRGSDRARLGVAAGGAPVGCRARRMPFCLGWFGRVTVGVVVEFRIQAMAVLTELGDGTR